ncbi:DUF4136 domain-containing protein [bacterium]|nr:DUF4136 domain-containing protein [bacterium]
MKKLILILILMGAIIMNGCSSMNVMVKYDDEVNFEKYKTFKFVRPRRQDQKSVRDPFLNKEVMQEISSMMEERGFEEAESMEKADLLVHFYAYVRNRSNYVPPTYHLGRWGRVRHVRPGHVMHYKTGTLVIDIVDAGAKEVVWQGVGKGVLDRFDPSTQLVQAVEEVLKDFPPVK